MVMPKKQRVAVYLRVGGNGDVEAVCEAQKAHFADVAAENGDWELMGFYADVGADSRTRPNLERLLADCLAGRVDLVVTKSLSRISRNIPVMMETVRALYYSKPPIGVYFEDIKLNTLEKNNFLLLNMFEAMLASEGASNKSMPRSFGAFLKMRKNLTDKNTEDSDDD